MNTASIDTQNTTQKILFASFLVAISGILYGFIGYLGTNLLRADMSVSTMLFWRFLSPVLGCFYLLPGNIQNKEILIRLTGKLYFSLLF